jgi:hypothetical protein
LGQNAGLGVRLIIRGAADVGVSLVYGVKVTDATEPDHGADPETAVTVATAEAMDADIASDTLHMPDEFVTQVTARVREPPVMVTDTVRPLTESPAVAVTVTRAAALHPLPDHVDTSARAVEVCEASVVVDGTAVVEEAVGVVMVVVVAPPTGVRSLYVWAELIGWEIR